MSPVLFIVMSSAGFQAGPFLSDTLIHNAIDMGGNTYYITGTLTPPGGTLYICRLNANGTFLVNQSKQPALTPIHTFLGWAIPA